MKGDELTMPVRTSVLDRQGTEEHIRTHPDEDGPPVSSPSAPRRDTPKADDLPPGSAGTGGQLVRLTVNLTPRSSEALEKASKESGDSKTDTVNRALQVYAVIQEMCKRGGGSIRVIHPDGEVERVHII